MHGNVVMNEALKKNYENLADTLIEHCNRRGIEAYYCEDREEALSTAKNFLTPGCTVSFGGSVTLGEVGILDELRNGDYVVYDRASAGTTEEKRALYGKIVTSDVFFTSTNALTTSGELVNIDGFGNRVACLITGPETVVVVAGINKIVPDVESGIKRVRNIAAPPNGVRLGLSTPCAEFGTCGDCLSKDCMCCQIVVTRVSRIPGRIKLILVGEPLGY